MRPRRTVESRARGENRRAARARLRGRDCGGGNRLGLASHGLRELVVDLIRDAETAPPAKRVREARLEQLFPGVAPGPLAEETSVGRAFDHGVEHLLVEDRLESVRTSGELCELRGGGRGGG